MLKSNHLSKAYVVLWSVASICKFIYSEESNGRYVILLEVQMEAILAISQLVWIPGGYSYVWAI